ncbi:SDR family NAD(P)-dependent oxidoreductase [Streptomyces sp. NPDC014872]|uniref:SDR family NAD(P)-dependent oxidoreductase n=1 Tax=Streptomyces sp. NPDC014872 TaxID=3364926 RepID=UPI0036F63B2E
MGPRVGPTRRAGRGTRTGPSNRPCHARQCQVRYPPAAASAVPQPDGGGRVLFVPSGVSVEADAAALVAAALSEFGRLDGAFNNAGSVNASGPVSGIDGAAWNAEVAQDVTSVFTCLRHQVPEVLKTCGAIVDNASGMGVVALLGVAPYVAAKHTVVGPTRATALEVAEQGVTCRRRHHRRRRHAPGPFLDAHQ